MHKIKEMTMKPFVLKQWENKKPLTADRLICPSRKTREEIEVKPLALGGQTIAT
jgi:hypothetical protein